VTSPLEAFVRGELAAQVAPQVRELAQRLAEARGARAALFYGSNLRTGDLEGVLDFYLLTPTPHRRGVQGLAERWLWPEVSYHEEVVDGRMLRAKAATMTLADFRAAAEGRELDTTVWTRFVQPVAIAWTADPAAADAALASVMQAARTAARFAAALGPPQGEPRAYWKALFRRTYQAELRIEKPGREDQVLGFDPDHYEQLLPLAWQADGVAFERQGEALAPQLDVDQRRRILAAWRLRQLFGKPLNAARLMKATFTFEGAARYASWKIERHTGVAVPVTPWRERHPILAAPGVLLRLWRARRS
jgi:hypothetical protein